MVQAKQPPLVFHAHVWRRGADRVPVRSEGYTEYGTFRITVVEK